jgi:hypothetical protein
VQSFSSDPYILTFAKLYCYVSGGDPPATILASKFATSALRDCLAGDRPETLSAYLWLYRLVRGAVNEVDPLAIWNLRIIEAVICGSGNDGDGMSNNEGETRRALEKVTSTTLIDRLFLETSLVKLDTFFSWFAGGWEENVFEETVGSVGDLLLAPSIEKCEGVGHVRLARVVVEQLRRDFGWTGSDSGTETGAIAGADLTALMANEEAFRLAASFLIFHY